MALKVAGLDMVRTSFNPPSFGDFEGHLLTLIATAWEERPTPSITWKSRVPETHDDSGHGMILVLMNVDDGVDDDNDVDDGW